MVFVDNHNPPESSSDLTSLISKEKFKDNGGCGYVLKPPYAIYNGTPFPASSLCVHLLSAQWLPELATEVIPFLIQNYSLAGSGARRRP